MDRDLIGIVYNRPGTSDHGFPEASQDVLVQVEAVEGALGDLGHPTARIVLTKDVRAFFGAMGQAQARMVFNLCETVDEDARFAGHPAALLELMGMPFSGSPSLALMLTTDKVTTKRLLQGAGILTPGYATVGPGNLKEMPSLHYPVIVKPRFEDASVGIDQESVFESEEGLRKGVGDFVDRFGEVLVEEFVGGREFNVSLLGYPSAGSLPVAEIEFSDFPRHLYPIVGYRAKWEKTSFEYHHTPRRFPQDLCPALAEALTTTAARCFTLFMLRDYGRVDMRVDARRRVHVLEVNANPCLSPDAGFAAAAAEAGMGYGQMVGALLSFLMQRLN